MNNTGTATVISGQQTEDGETLAAEPVPPDIVYGHDGRGPLDCLLIDHGHSGIDGIDLARAAVDNWSDIPVLLLADGDDEAVVAAIEAGITETLPRQLVDREPELLADRIASVVKRERERVGYRRICDRCPDSLMVIDPGTGRLLHANQTLCDLLGYDRKELCSMRIGDLTADDPECDHERVRSVVTELATEHDKTEPETENEHRESPIEVEWPLRTVDDEVRWVTSRLSATTVADQTAVLVTATDITDSHESIRGRDREGDGPSALFDNNPDPVIRVRFEDDDPIIREVNPAFERVFGFERTDVLGTNPFETLLPESERAEHGHLREQLHEKSKSLEPEIAMVTADGVRDFLSRVIRFDRDTNEGGTAEAYVRYTDVTERRRRERAINRLHVATRELITASTVEGVVDTVVQATEEVLGFSLNGVRVYDESDDVLRPVETTEATKEEIGPRPISTRGETVHWQVLGGEDPVVFDSVEEIDDAFDRPRVGSVMYVPLGDHGVLSVGRREECGIDEIDQTLARLLAANATVALDRVERERQRRESERRLRAILDRIDEAIYLARVHELNEPSAEPDYLSSGYEQIWGQSLTEINDTRPGGFFDTLHPDDEADYRAFVNGIISDVDAGTAADRYSREYRIERPDGSVRWVHSDYYPTEWGGDDPRIVVLSRDVTDRRARQRRLTSFNEATDDLATADSPTEATEQAVEAATGVLDLQAVGVFLYDENAGVLEPEAFSEDVPADLEEAEIGPDEGPLWKAFATGTPVPAGGRTGELDAREGRPSDEKGLAALDDWQVLALGNHGVLLVGTTEGSLDRDRIQSAHVLAATLEAALNHLRGRKQLAAQKEQLRTQTERAERLDRIARITHEVEAAITDASGPDEVERAVCTHLAGSGPYELAWIGGVDVGSDRITPRAIVGESHDYVDRMDLTTTDASTEAHPAIRAWRTEETVVTESVVGSGPTGSWRRHVLAAGYQTVCAVPLTYDGVTHGVLTVGTESPNAFGDRERDVLTQLGTSIGYALAAIERRRALETDKTVELEFAGKGGDLPFARAAEAANCRVRHERTVPHEGDEVSVYFSFEEDPPPDITEIVEETLLGDIETVTDGPESVLVEIRTDTWFGAPLAEYGGILRRATATPETTTIVVEVPADANVRSFVGRLGDLAPSLDLVAKRHHEHRDRTPEELRDRIERQLTDRQLEALQTALSAGYFEWPREVDSTEVAQRLDITQPTLNRHLRLAERKTFEFLFETDG